MPTLRIVASPFVEAYGPAEQRVVDAPDLTHRDQDPHPGDPPDRGAADPRSLRRQDVGRAHRGGAPPAARRLRGPGGSGRGHAPLPRAPRRQRPGRDDVPAPVPPAGRGGRRRLATRSVSRSTTSPPGTRSRPATSWLVGRGGSGGGRIGQRRQARSVELSEFWAAVDAGVWLGRGFRSPSAWLAAATGEPVGACKNGRCISASV